MHKKSNILLNSFLFVLAVGAILPIIHMIWMSFGAEGDFSFQAYARVFLTEPGYLVKFWRSLVLSTLVALGQTILSCITAFALKSYKVRGTKMMLCIMVLFMILPIQVTLFPNYLLLNYLNLLDTWWALLLPSVFSPFGTLWLTFILMIIPKEYIEAAFLDGADAVTVLYRIVVPMIKAPMVSLFLISFVDSWNMVEQPMTFLQEARSYPLSVFLVIMNEQNVAMQSVCGMLCLIPVTLLFFYYHEEFIDGIADAFALH